MFFYKT